MGPLEASYDFRPSFPSFLWLPVSPRYCCRIYTLCVCLSASPDRPSQGLLYNFTWGKDIHIHSCHFIDAQACERMSFSDHTHFLFRWSLILNQLSQSHTHSHSYASHSHLLTHWPGLFSLLSLSEMHTLMCTLFTSPYFVPCTSCRSSPCTFFFPPALLWLDSCYGIHINIHIYLSHDWGKCMKLSSLA